MYWFLLISFILCFVCCSPIQTIDGLERNLSASYIPSDGSIGNAFGDGNYRDYNASISDSNETNVGFSECGDFHLEDNKAVRDWIDYFADTPKGRDFMKGALERSNRYISLMEGIISRNGLPSSLAYVPLIESGFRCDAVSKRKAVGCWQFLEGTAKDYKLLKTGILDERRDPELATKAAVKYLTDLCRTFGDWHLALAAYNLGPTRLGTVIVNNFNRDFWYLAKKGRLGDETRDYVPQIMAAIKIAKAPYKYGFDDLNLHDRLEYRLMKVPKRSDFENISNRHGFSYKVLRDLNPMFLYDEIPGTGRTSHIRVPL